MTERVMTADALQVFLKNTLRETKVLVRENNRVITIEPVGEKNSCCSRVRGMLADCPDMSVDKFLERKYADKELDV